MLSDLEVSSVSTGVASSVFVKISSSWFREDEASSVWFVTESSEDLVVVSEVETFAEVSADAEEAGSSASTASPLS